MLQYKQHPREPPTSINTGEQVSYPTSDGVSPEDLLALYPSVYSNPHDADLTGYLHSSLPWRCLECPLMHGLVAICHVRKSRYLQKCRCFLYGLTHTCVTQRLSFLGPSSPSLIPLRPSIGVVKVHGGVRIFHPSTSAHLARRDQVRSDRSLEGPVGNAQSLSVFFCSESSRR